MSFTFEKPLIPSDEDQLNRSDGRSRPHNHLVQESSVASVPALLRGQENLKWDRHVYGYNLRRPSLGEKALTDTSNFIAINGDLVDSPGRKKSADTSGSGLNSITSSESENILESPSVGANMKGIPVSDTLKAREEEWADRGAAKIVQEVVNPQTGVATKQVIKKGIKDFKFGDVLGDGSYSTVILAKSNDSGKKYAVKVLNKEYLIRQKKVKYVNIEKNTLQRLNNSRGVIKLYFTFQDEASLYFLLEYAPNGDFLSVMKKFGSLSEECVSYYGAQIIDAIDFIHQKGVVHRDIKPENILLDKEMKVKLTDFGTAKLLEENSDTKTYDLLERSKSFVGTAEYVSPELLNENYVDYKCDIWAFGCIIFQMIAGKPPFKAANEYLTFQKVMKVQFAFTAGFPLVIRDLVRQILVKNPDSRPSCREIKRHPLFKGLNFRDGTLWEAPAPEIAPYKVTATAMQPVPGLGDSKSRSAVSLAKQTKSSSPGSPIVSSTPPNETRSHEQKRPPLDPRTSQILENAKREIQNRRQNTRRVASAASAAAAALTKKSPASSPALTSTGGSSNENTPRKSTLPKAPATAPSPKTSSPSQFTTKKPISSKAVEELPPMSKVDILWSFYLKNINERTIKMGEVEFGTLKTPLFEKRLSKMNCTLVDPYKVAHRSTLLSQVARSGGAVTGFRNDNSSTNLTENDYYTEFGISEDTISESFKKTSNDDTDGNGKSMFKKLFHAKAEEAEKAPELLPHGNLLRRVLVLTTFGRLLVFVRRSKVQPETNLFFDLEYDIQLSQTGTKIKSVVFDDQASSAPTQDYFVIETPFKTFIVSCKPDDALSWLTAVNAGLKSNQERLLQRAKEEEPSPLANKAAKLASPKQEAEKDFGHSSELHVKPSRPVPTSGPTHASRPASKGSVTTQNFPSAAGNKPERLFDAFVSSKGKHGKKTARPVPASSKLVNGLPSMPGFLGPSSDYREIDETGSAQNSARRSPPSRILRMTSRNEHTLRK
ncbi:LAMI_0B06524g1_1 [Lachancea mirantina]|uniref:non-specific serine/threonine protein kinase n=1 Tax=Lachancea mirantina TaxID=1230905 RepID=A0A1G4IWP1_9SACH|nr:LAMI_0B06524g1_1 [Lachancea mirantina]